MRKINFQKALVLLVLCFFYRIIFSQTVYSSNESSTFSFTAGLTSTNLIKDSVAYSSGILFSAGGVYILTLSDRFNFGIEASYTGKSVKTDSPYNKYRYFYADVPLYIQWKLNKSFRINAGLQYSKFTNSIVSSLDSVRNSSSGVHNKTFRNIKDMDYSFLLGTEFNLTKNLVVGARYTLSISTFLNDASKHNFGVFQFSLRYVVYRGYKELFNHPIKPT